MCSEGGIVPDVSSHPDGAFSWVELATTDPAAAVAFYRDLFGWDVVQHDMGPDGVYTIFTMRGRDVAAAAGQHPQERDRRIPPHWKLYVNVNDADAAAKRAASLGGVVEAPPFDVMNHGRMAVIQDPTGAVFQLWQPKEHIGVGITAEPGALCWSELTTRDPRAAEQFYTAMFEWTVKHGGAGTPGEYREFSVADQPGGGIMETPKEMPPDIPSYWMPYFQVATAEAAVATATAKGGRLMIGPAPIPGTGQFAILTDPQGAMFAVFQRE
jgi:predicted enzyme related to lactoylglutathione lyase